MKILAVVVAALVAVGMAFGGTRHTGPSEDSRHALAACHDAVARVVQIGPNVTYIAQHGWAHDGPTWSIDGLLDVVGMDTRPAFTCDVHQHGATFTATAEVDTLP